MKHTLQQLASVSVFMLAVTIASAADKKPKAMTPKLVEASTILVQDDFAAEKPDPKWISEGDGSGIIIEEGALRIDGPAGGTRGLAETKFAEPVQDVHLQFLLKPLACQSIAFGFRQKTAFGYSVYGEIARFGVVDRTLSPPGQPPYVSSFKPVTVATEQKDPKAWRRISIECKGNKLLVRQDNKKVAELEHPFVGEEKTAFVLAGYGGVFMIDEVLIATPAKK